MSTTTTKIRILTTETIRNVVERVWLHWCDYILECK